MRPRSLLPLMLGMLLTACTVPGLHQAAAGGSAAAGADRARGRLDGTMIREGGPIGPGGQQPARQRIPGVITITAAGHQTRRVRAGSSGRFSVLLPAARYRLCGASPRSTGPSGAAARCARPRAVTIRAGRTTTVTVIFAVP
jgi:hypothetical protein